MAAVNAVFDLDDLTENRGLWTVYVTSQKGICVGG